MPYVYRCKVCYAFEIFFADRDKKYVSTEAVLLPQGGKGGEEETPSRYLIDLFLHSVNLGPFSARAKNRWALAINGLDEGTDLLQMYTHHKARQSTYRPYVSCVRARIIALVATCSLDSRHPGSEVTAIRNAMTPDSRHLRASYETP